MELPTSEVLAILRKKGAEWLFHANTVRTVCTFLRTQHLLARGIVHERGLDQTDQKTDRTDRELGVWYDIFFDASDIHQRASKRNLYGPVALRFDLSLLEQDWLPVIWVTKLNPIYWKKDTPSHERWFTSIDELEKGYSPSRFAQHIVLRNVGGSVRLAPYLKEIILDNPHKSVGNDHFQIDLMSHATGAIRSAARIGNFLSKMPPLNLRRDSNCQCQEEYKEMNSKMAIKLFGS